MSSEGWLYDGETANRYPIVVSRDGADLEIMFGNGVLHRVPAARLVHVESRGSTEVYGRNDIAGWRLGVVKPDSDMAALLPEKERYGRWVDRIGLVPAAIAGLVISGLVLLAGNKAPEWIAPAVPRQWEERFGDTLVGDFGGKACKGAAGRAALIKLAGQLSPNAGELNIRVVDVDTSTLRRCPAATSSCSIDC